MECHLVRAKLEHIAEIGEPSPRTWRRAAPQNGKRGAHRGRIGIVALIEEGNRACAARLGEINRDPASAPLRRRPVGKRTGCNLPVGARRNRSSQCAKCIQRKMCARRADGEREILIQN